MARPAHKLRRRPPFFLPVPLRARCDGWTVERQCAFLAALYATGSVGAAAGAVGMARRGAYRLREREGAEDFARAWDAVLTLPGTGPVAPPNIDWRKVTNRTLLQRIESGLVRPVIYRGRMVGVQRKPDNFALFRLLRRCDAVCSATDYRTGTA